MTGFQALLQLAPLFDCVDDALAWVKDLEGRYRWVNRAFLTSYALERGGPDPIDDPGMILGKTDYDLTSPFLADQFRLDDELVLEGARVVNRIELVGPPGGPPEWNITNKIPLRDADGSVIGTAGLSRRLDADGLDNLPDRPFASVLAYIRDHCREPVGNAELARVAHMSVRTFERRFRDAFHLSPQKYLRRLQLRMASRALAMTRKPLAEVSQDCGFADQSHFSREFRRHFGRTPRQFREHYTRGAADAPGTRTDAADQASREAVG
ncbi:HTH-type transcriptional activator RhaS [Aquisphaera giovannonii]|uniref:HTH-type transcriptional activator RhaS n=1 Tax=Aquisphaera giovannonii TaxID=406548 RepID=A0A5B9VXJ9_9BACT|nr:AraC family transcriptional regulator [Aquisphaera giovannonii]QEH32601.1 HTH-type transcriptional activator RhaS [Aquisphaera giovannonii]